LNAANFEPEKLTSAAVERQYLQRRPVGGSIFVVSGPAGVGKDTVIERLMKLEDDLRQVVTVTTRSPREGEWPGHPYQFIGEGKFDRMLAKSEFLEWAAVYGERYGTPIESVRDVLRSNHDCLLKIDVQGAAQVRRRAPNAVLIFIGPPSIESLRRRLAQRGVDDEASVRRRQVEAEFELARLVDYDYLVINHDGAPEVAAQQIHAIIQAERSRIERHLTDI